MEAVSIDTASFGLYIISLVDITGDIPLKDFAPLENYLSLVFIYITTGVWIWFTHARCKTPGARTIWS